MQEAIFNMLLDKLHMQGLLSLEPVLHVVAALARDLQSDFVCRFPRLCSKVTELISAGVPTPYAWAEKLRARSLSLSDA